MIILKNISIQNNDILEYKGRYIDGQIIINKRLIIDLEEFKEILWHELSHLVVQRDNPYKMTFGSEEVAKEMTKGLDIFREYFKLSDDDFMKILQEV